VDTEKEEEESSELVGITCENLNIENLITEGWKEEEVLIIFTSQLMIYIHYYIGCKKSLEIYTYNY